MLKMRKILILAIVCMMALSISGCGSKAEKVSAPITPKAEQEQTVEAFGTVKCTDIRNINIDFAAVVSKVNVIEGQRVKNGDILLSINTQNYQTQIRNKEIELDGIKIELSGLNRDYSIKQDALNQNNHPDIKKCMNDKKYAEEMYNKALQDLAVKEELYNAGGISKSDVDEFKKVVSEKKKAIDDAQSSLDNARWNLQRELEQLKTSIDQKSSQAASMELDINNMKEKLDKNCIKGNDIVCDVPNGVVSEVACVQGDIVVATEEGRKILSIMNTDSMIVEADVAEEFIKDVKIGSEVVINPQADKSRSYKGKVTSIAEKAVQKNNETIVPVRISVENIDSFLLPDFNVDVKFSIDGKKQG